MTDRLFTAALTFILLAGGTLAIGSALFGLDRPATHELAMATLHLPRVEVTARRAVAMDDAPAVETAAAAAVRSLPRVEVVGHRMAGLAAATAAEAAHATGEPHAAIAAAIDAARGAREALAETTRADLTASTAAAREHAICIE